MALVYRAANLNFIFNFNHFPNRFRGAFHLSFGHLQSAEGCWQAARCHLLSGCRLQLVPGQRTQILLCRYLCNQDLWGPVWC